MTPMQAIIARARALDRHILLPEAADPRIREAAAAAVGEGIARVTLLDPAPDDLDMLAAAYHDLRRAKGIRDDGQPGLSDAARDQLLRSVAKARRWLRDLACDATTFEAIAHAEGCCERHIRFLAPLAFLSPTVVAAIHDGHAPAQLTASTLARETWAVPSRV